ncbi:MAG: diacylglycerol kinase family lipid kinase [Clostridia bacterium]|nr:diacylglycerol kinase family lipid kinase [Clostridia bacterium]
MLHLIANPIAGTKKVVKNLKKIRAILDARGVEYVVHETTHRGEGKELAERLTEEDGVEIVVVGGDGTLHEVLNGIRDVSKCRLGLIPSGTGNDFAAAANIPCDAEAALEIILNGEAKDTDYLSVGGKRCMNVSGMGIDVDVLVRYNKGKKKSKFQYLKNLIVSFFKFNGYEVTVECEGETFDMKSLIVVACNGNQFGGGIPISPNSKVDDRKLDVIAVECFKSKWSILKAFIILMRGKIMGYPHKRYFLAEKVKVTPKQPSVVNLDGELYENLAFDVELCHGLHMYRP